MNPSWLGAMVKAAVIAGVAGAGAATAAGECSPPRLISPPPGQTVGDSRPVIAIASDALRHSTRLVAEIRSPEKEILQRVDTELKSDVLQLPGQATLYRANIKLALHATCKGDAPEAAERIAIARIYVDTGLACRPPREVVRSGAELRWARPEEADRTEIALLSADDGREFRRLDENQNRLLGRAADLDAPDRGGFAGCRDPADAAAQGVCSRHEHERPCFALTLAVKFEILFQRGKIEA